MLEDRMWSSIFLWFRRYCIILSYHNHCIDEADVNNDRKKNVYSGASIPQSALPRAAWSTTTWRRSSRAGSRTRPACPTTRTWRRETYDDRLWFILYCEMQMRFFYTRCCEWRPKERRLFRSQPPSSPVKKDQKKTSLHLGAEKKCVFFWGCILSRGAKLTEWKEPPRAPCAFVKNWFERASVCPTARLFLCTCVMPETADQHVNRSKLTLLGPSPSNAPLA